MPMPSFLASIADKAQSAIHPSGANAGERHPTVTALHNQLRALGQQYTSTTPIQKLITVEKSVAIDFDAVARDAKFQSKELYTWGQTELEDIKDVTDRLAYLNFVQGSLANSLASKLDAARAPVKALRDAESAIAPRRNVRAGLQLELARMEHSQQKGLEKKIAELKEQIKKAELDDEPQEKEIQILKRKAIRGSEQAKWEAFREYGEKLALLSQAAAPIIGVLPSLPPSTSHPYAGSQATGAARASLQRALDNYKTGHINLPPEPTGADLHRSDTRSFGESHASELSSITSDSDDSFAVPHPASATPPPTEHKLPVQPLLPLKPLEPSPINVANLNRSPAEVPLVSSVQEAEPSSLAAIPTIAETGIPVAAGSEGPGPASGSLRDLRDDAPNPSSLPINTPNTTASATSTVLMEPQPQPARYESADEEKKRLEREEREQILRGGSSNPENSTPEIDEDLPPKYQEF